MRHLSNTLLQSNCGFPNRSLTSLWSSHTHFEKFTRVSTMGGFLTCTAPRTAHHRTPHRTPHTARTGAEMDPSVVMPVVAAC